jgi:hydroxymethylglutaryl-CoA lyase
MNLPTHVTMVDVGPRDGLQNEKQPVATAHKVELVRRLQDAGLKEIEVTSFVSPKWVPQMADAVDVARAVKRRDGTRYLALVPNRVGLARAIESGLREIAVFAAASETFSCKNINQSIEESLAAYADVAAEAQRNGVRVRGYLSTAFGCPYEGAVPVERVVDVASRLIEMGCNEVAVSDTIGVAHPGQVADIVDAVAVRVPRQQIALHFHDTRGTALANVYAALERGIAIFDSSAGGLGGCPYAPGAAGNLATEDLIYLLNGLVIETGVNLEGVVRASTLIADRIGHALPSRYYQAARAAASS